MIIIKLTHRQGHKVYVVAENISSYEREKGDTYTHLKLNGSHFANVRETPAQITSLIQDALM